MNMKLRYECHQVVGVEKGGLVGIEEGGVKVAVEEGAVQVGQHLQHLWLTRSPSARWTWAMPQLQLA